MTAPLDATQKVINEYSSPKLPGWQRVMAINLEIGLFEKFGDYSVIGYTEAPDGHGRVIVMFPKLMTKEHYLKLEEVAKSYNLEMDVKAEGAVILKDNAKNLPVAYIAYNGITMLPPDEYEDAGKLLADIGSIIGISDGVKEP